MHDFRRLKVWQRSRALAVRIDALTRTFPRSDGRVVGRQLRRSALSIPANISEGCGLGSRRETIRFFQVASRSALETENHLLIAADLGYLDSKTREETTGEVKEIQRMLSALIDRLPD